ncbi:MAG: hypothetical protein HUK03_07130, partial [Bacteroidaceae bacterium]|nr:hypothetical protein [Bacteroidaceae bacterium]
HTALREELLSQWLARLSALQDANGGFAWYPGLPASSYITTEVAYLLARLHAMTGDTQTTKVLDRSLKYLTANADTTLTTRALQQLYINGLMGKKLSQQQRKMVADLPDEAKHWDRERQALAAIVLQQQRHTAKARQMVETIDHYLVTHPDRGTYIEYPEGAHSSIDKKLRVHTLLMEALGTVTPSDTTRLRGMRRWLLQQKRVQGWKTPIQCVDAVYALLRDDADLTDRQRDQLTLRVGNRMLTLASPDGQRGYVRQTLAVKSAPTALQVRKQSAGESWAAVFVQSLQQVDSVGDASTGLRVYASCVAPLPQQDVALRVAGQRVMRYVITADRDYEYVALRAERAACCEPVLPTSGCQRQDGLYYYRTVRDNRTEYFFQSLPRGTYVIEEPVYVEREGSYATGLTTIVCQYASEFQARSASKRIGK